ncbi:uncharacterized protein LY89DRAFT_738323 [Mollisia scopiformis]|uniref:F-box domain-containing protein n=1 Tax=Mollisia scopiformis TaxID=149040 RepID=A0A194WY71_MOLSC|nr:uncharacterized protein LY89DRAFT_738323 [Mollisia scopiformis]KUJ12547.1 hypothetical protein LY89DRAFT_738323 [Mollisia scopiformis]
MSGSGSTYFGKQGAAMVLISPVQTNFMVASLYLLAHQKHNAPDMGYKNKVGFFVFALASIVYQSPSAVDAQTDKHSNSMDFASIVTMLILIWSSSHQLNNCLRDGVPRFVELPSELQDEVVRNCTPSDQLAFARTSKDCHQQTIPLLYHQVDCSVHNRPGLFPGRHCKLVSADNPLLDDNDLRLACEHRQQLFLAALNSNDTYGHQRGTYLVRVQLLPNVKFLDFASLAFKRQCLAPPSLFPCVTHLRLLGQMTFAVVRAFTDFTDPAQLISLEFDNLQDFGQLNENEKLPALADLAKIRESKDKEGNSIVRHPGVMRGHLQHLEGKCSNLRSLCLRSVGNDRQLDSRWSPTIDAARYKEWATFIISVSPTLENLVIEQGVEVDDTDVLHCRPQPVQVGRPMDSGSLNTFCLFCNKGIGLL